MLAWCLPRCCLRGRRAQSYRRQDRDPPPASASWSSTNWPTSRCRTTSALSPRSSITRGSVISKCRNRSSAWAASSSEQVGYAWLESPVLGESVQGSVVGQAPPAHAPPSPGLRL